MADWRLFIAVDPEPKVTARIGEWVAAVRAAGLGGRLRWSRTENYHLTLVFLGSVPEERVAEIRSALQAVASEGFEIRYGGVGAFPEARHPRVLWVGVEDASGKLNALADQVNRAMRGLGLQTEERAFTPHLTIAKVPHEIRLSRTFTERLRARALVPQASFVRELVLYRSRGGAEGSRYEAIARFPLMEA